MTTPKRIAPRQTKIQILVDHLLYRLSISAQETIPFDIVSALLDELKAFLANPDLQTESQLALIQELVDQIYLQEESN